MNDFEFRMSKMEMVLNCTAGYHKSRELETVPCEAANDGTGTHHLIDLCFKFGYRSADIYKGCVLKSSAGEYLVDIDRVERADVMLKRLFDFQDSGFDVETEVKLEWYMGGEEGCQPIHGTCDAVVYGGESQSLYILDYKDGRVAVDSENNAQLLMYASAVIQMRNLGSLSHIELSIVQPKISHDLTNTSIVYGWDIRNFQRNVVNSIGKVPNGANDFNAGNWCRYCPFKGRCKSYVDNALHSINTTRDTVLTDAIRITNDETPEMSDVDLVALKKAAPLIKELFIAVDKELYARSEVGDVEGVKLVPGRNQRSWNADDETILKKFSGIKIPKKYQHTMKVLSPSQFSKLVWNDKEGNTQSLSKIQIGRFFKNNLQEVKGRPQLVLSDDNRQEVNNDKRGLFKTTGE